MDNKPAGYYDPKPDPEERRNEVKFQRAVTRAEVFPAITDEQVELRESVRSEHQKNVDAIKRRSLHERIVAKLRHWKVLEVGGYPLELSDKAEVVLLTTMLDEVVKEMEDAGQPV